MTRHKCTQLIGIDGDQTDNKESKAAYLTNVPIDIK